MGEVCDSGVRVHEGLGYVFSRVFCAVARRAPMLGAGSSPGEDPGPGGAAVLGSPAPASPMPRPWLPGLIASCNVASRDTKMGDAYYLPMESILAKSML